MAMPLVDCPKCGGTGRRRFPNEREACELCGGTRELPADFAERTASPRREKRLASCEDCLEMRICVLVERDGLTVPLCAPCYTREMHPHLLVVPTAESLPV